MDEFQDIPKEAFTEVLRPTLSDKQGRALFTGTPKGYGSWSHELFTTALRTEGWNAWQFSTIEGGNVPESEIEAARRDLDERTFQQEYEAKFSNYGGVVAYNFDYKQSVRALEKPNLDMIHVGIDFNITPGTCSIATVFGDTVHFFDEIHMANSNTDMLAEELKTRYPHSKIVVYPDPSGRRKGTSSGGRSDLSILQNAGFIVKARPRHTPIKDRVNAFNARLKNTKGERKCFFDPKCKHIIDSVGRLSYIEGTSQIDKDSGLDHQFDSVTYLVDYIWPIRTVYEVDEPQRWAFGGGQRW
jgi:hypothetical protein